MNVVNIFDIYCDYNLCCDIFNDPCKSLIVLIFTMILQRLFSTCNDPSNTLCIRILFDNFVFVQSKSLKERIGFEFQDEMTEKHF